MSLLVVNDTTKAIEQLTRLAKNELLSNEDSLCIIYTRSWMSRSYFFQCVLTFHFFSFEKAKKWLKSRQREI